MDVALTASLVSPIVTREANGPHAVIADLARGLAARGHRTTVYAAAGSRLAGARLVPVSVPPDAAAARIRPGDGGPPASDLRRAFARLFAAVGRGDHDVVLQHAFDAPAIELAEGLPVLHVLHLPPIVESVVAAARATRSPLAAVSRSAAVDWAGAGVAIDRVLANGVPDRGWSAHAERPAALVAGRISPEKGTATAIRAAIRAGLTPWLVGDVYDEAYFEREVRPILTQVRWFGPRSRGDVSRLMRHAAVTLMPVGWPEPFGLVAAESQMAGCPVVAYRRGALPEVVEDGVSGILVPPDDGEGLVAALREVGTLDRRRVRASALRRLGVDRMLDDYEDAARRLASSAALGRQP